MKNVKSYFIDLNTSDGKKMPLYVALRDDLQKTPGLIVLQEAFGVNSHIKSLCHKFAEEGFLAVAPELFHRTAQHFDGSYGDFDAVMPHLKAVTESTLEMDVKASFDWLKSQSQIPGDRISAIGYCMGGKAAYISNATLPLRSAISYYGGGIAPALLPLAAKQHGPLMLIWGGLDKHITAEHRAQITEALTKESKSFVNIEFSQAHHAFSNDERTASYNPEATREAWAIALQFLKR